MKRIRRSTVLVAAIVLALVGAVATPAFAKTEKQIAKASTVRITDLSGTDWTSSPHQEDPDPTIPACQPTNKVENAGQKYSAHSPDFESAGVTTLTNTVYVFPTVKQAKAYLAAFKLRTALECLQQGLDETVQDTPGASAEVGTIDVSGGPFDDGIGFAGVVRGVPGAPDGSTQDIYLQAVAFRVGRAVTGFTTTNVGEVYPETEEVVVKQIKRLKKNLR